MKRKVFVVLLTLWILALTHLAIAEGFSPTYFGGSGLEHHSGSVALPDGGLLITGSFTSADGPGKDRMEGFRSKAWILRLDQNGNTVLDLLYGTKDGTNRFNSAMIDGVGNMILSYVHADSKSIERSLITIDAKGSILSETRLKKAVDMVTMGPAGPLLSGDDHVKRTKKDTLNVPFIDALNTDGKSIWREVYEELADCGIVIAFDKGNMLICGSMEERDGGENLYAYGAKLDENGKLLWITPVLDEGFSILHGIAPLPDGGAIAVGEWEFDPLLVIFDAEGNVRKRTIIDQDEISGYFDSLVPWMDGYVAVSIVEQNKFCLAWIDANGDIQKTWIVQPEGSKRVTFVTLCVNGEFCYLVASVNRNDVEDMAKINSDIWVAPVTLPEV